MKIRIVNSVPRNETLVLFAFEKESSKIIQEASQFGFSGKIFSTVYLQPKGAHPAKGVLLVGLGEKKNINSETLRRASAAAIKKLEALHQKEVAYLPPRVLEDLSKESCALSEGALLGSYKFTKYKSSKESHPVRVLSLVAPKNEEAQVKKGVRLAQILCESTLFVRDLVNEPPSSLPPSRFAEYVKEVAEAGASSNIKLSLYDKEKIEEMGMGSFLGVNRGSAEPPIFVHLHYKPKESTKSIALVGKGITFDSGGLSLKPAESMETMKMDMAGAASILGTFKALAQLKPNIEVHGIMALTENMPGGRAYKPGDVLKAMNGKTIEVLNTDAEGRLILADALSYAVEQNPDLIIDIATLTAAVTIALGSQVAAVMGNNQELISKILSVSEDSGEKFWQLPLVKEYREGLNSPVADIKNISSTRKEGGSIVAGLFLQEFVKDVPWAHLDVAGTAWTDKEFGYYSQGGTGFPTRTLIRYLLSI